MKAQRKIGLYFGTLMLSSGLGDPLGLVSLPVLFILKDRLRLTPSGVAIFEGITLIPYYGALLFGVLRDRWKPFGCGDRGYLMLGAPIAVACYVWLAAVPLGYGRLLAGMLGAMIAYQLLDVATEAIAIQAGRREAMTGRLSALSEIIDTTVSITSMLVGGWLASRYSPSAAFLIAGAFSAVLFCQAIWRPGMVFENQQSDALQTMKDSRAILQKLQQGALRPTVIILLLYNFSPGWGTPLLYFLTDRAALSSESFGACRAVQFAGVLVASAAYGVLCRRMPLKRLLWYAVLLNAMPGFLFLLVRGGATAFAVSALVGLVSGFANVALLDLLMRACPQGLEGSGSSLGHTAFGLAGVAGDLVGAFLYERGGFALCLFLDAAATVMILPFLTRLPWNLISGCDSRRAASLTAEA